MLELNVLLTCIIHEIRSERSFIILMQVLSIVSFSSELRILIPMPTIQFTNNSHDPLTLLLDCKSWWNSTYIMLHCAHLLRDAIKHFITINDDDISELQLTEHEWHHVEYLLQLLYDFHLWTSVLSEHHDATIHQICITYSNHD